MNVRLGLYATVLGAVLLASSGANAGLITAGPAGSTVYSLGNSNVFGAGPQTVAPGITWSSTNAFNQGGSVYGWTSGYGFSGNGSWDAAIGGMAGLNDSFGAYGVTDTMTFSFANPVQSVGGFINYVPGGSTPTVISIYNSAHQLLDTFDLTFLTGGGTDTGEFLGFEDPTADISSFTLTDNYIGITDFTVLNGAQTVPEPSSFSIILMGLGLLGSALYLGRKKVPLT